MSYKRNKKVARFCQQRYFPLEISDMPAKKKYDTISFRPPPEIRVKIDRAMALSGHKNQTKLIIKALEAGLHLLEENNWDLSQAYIRSLMHQAKPEAIPATPHGLKPLESPKESIHSTRAAGVTKS